jgi:hypothetical protein
MSMVAKNHSVTHYELPSYHVLMLATTSFFTGYGCHVLILEEARVLQRLGHHVRIATHGLRYPPWHYTSDCLFWQDSARCSASCEGIRSFGLRCYGSLY